MKKNVLEVIREVIEIQQVAARKLVLSIFFFFGGGGLFVYHAKNPVFPDSISII